jgi:hypothetical protein
LDLAVRRGLSLYTIDRARGTVDTAAFAPEAENPIVDAPEKKQQKGDFIFRWVHLTPFHNPFGALVCLRKLADWWSSVSHLTPIDVAIPPCVGWMI